METKPLVPAAQYLRVSTERQEYSLDFQGAEISSYAEHNGFVIVETYRDEAKSGLVIKHRAGLSGYSKMWSREDTATGQFLSMT